MLCQVCLKKTARFHSPKLVNNEIVHIHLCRDCLEKKNNHDMPNGFDEKLHHVLDGLIRTKGGLNKAQGNVSCEICNTTLSDLKKSSLVGCPHCYEVFSDQLAKDTRKTATAFAKEFPHDSYSNRLLNLKSELQKAVELEDFEKAAELRDRIRSYEVGGFTRDH